MAKRRRESGEGKVHFAFYRTVLREETTEWENSKTPCGHGVDRIRALRPEFLTEDISKATCSRCLSVVKTRDDVALGRSGSVALKDFVKSVRGIAAENGWKFYSNASARNGFPNAVMARSGEIIFAHLSTTVSRKSTAEEIRWRDALGAVEGAEAHRWRPPDALQIETRLKRPAQRERRFA